MFPQRKKKTLTLKVHAFFKANLSLDCLEKVLYSLIMDQIIVQRRKVIWTTSQQSMHHSLIMEQIIFLDHLLMLSRSSHLWVLFTVFNLCLIENRRKYVLYIDINNHIMVSLGKEFIRAVLAP